MQYLGCMAVDDVTVPWRCANRRIFLAIAVAAAARASAADALARRCLVASARRRPLSATSDAAGRCVVLILDGSCCSLKRSVHRRGPVTRITRYRQRRKLRLRPWLVRRLFDIVGALSWLSSAEVGEATSTLRSPGRRSRWAGGGEHRITT